MLDSLLTVAGTPDEKELVVLDNVDVHGEVVDRLVRIQYDRVVVRRVILCVCGGAGVVVM